MREAFSTARPSRLRLSSFLALVLGGAMLGIGALSTWGSVAFPAEVDPTGNATAVIPGVDLWEGMLVLAASALVLVGTLALRLVRGDQARRLIAVSIIVVGLVAAALAASVAIDAEDRLVQTEGLDAYARARSEQRDIPYEEARADIAELVREDLVVATAPGVWVAAGGGLVAGVGGILSLAWAREVSRERELRPAPD